MKTADYTYGDADDVADRLMESGDVSLSDLHAALINALRRIAALENSARQARDSAPA